MVLQALQPYREDAYTSVPVETRRLLVLIPLHVQLRNAHQAEAKPAIGDRVGKRHLGRELVVWAKTT